MVWMFPAVKVKSVVGKFVTGLAESVHLGSSGIQGIAVTTSYPNLHDTRGCVVVGLS